MSKNKKMIIYVIIALLIMTSACALLFLRSGPTAPGVKEIRKVENNINVEVGEKILVLFERENDCSFEKAPGGCPIYVVPSEYFDINFVTQKLPSQTKPCLRENYTIATMNKRGVAEITLKYACSDEVYKKYTVNIK